MEIKTKLYNKTLYVLLSGELDEHVAGRIRKNLDTLFDNEKGFNQVVMDLSELEFMDSTGIGLLIGRYKKLKQFNVPSYISGANVATEKVIALAGLYSIMPKFW